MENILKVTPEKLLEAAGEFETTSQNVRNITQEMISIVESFKSIWQGEAATGFYNRFGELSDQMNRLYTTIKDHSERLSVMANEYRNAEDESLMNAQSLVTEAQL